MNTTRRTSRRPAAAAAKRILTRTLMLAALVTVLTALAGATHADAAVRWDRSGTMTCWGSATARNWPPVVGSSGWIATIPQFVYADGSSHYGGWRFAYQTSNWQGTSGVGWTSEEFGNGNGQTYVYNWVYDYDTKSWSGNWSNWWEKNPVTGWFDTGLFGCAT